MQQDTTIAFVLVYNQQNRIFTKPCGNSSQGFFYARKAR
uniref:Uncharacterized protein n=1 Tax=Siphoviridae sp. ctLkp13 TaxID=2826252 RepID=A0A8S5LST7_9CAUD|nr:MAG TPA: hypothetical protein [Siphoviridae sp. ctLkp13]